MLSSNWRYGESGVYDTDEIGALVSEVELVQPTDLHADIDRMDVFHASLTSDDESERISLRRQYLEAVHALLESRGIRLDGDPEQEIADGDATAR